MTLKMAVKTKPMIWDKVTMKVEEAEGSEIPHLFSDPAIVHQMS